MSRHVQPKKNTRAKWILWPLRALLLVPFLLLGPLGVLAFGNLDLATHWIGIDFNDLALRLPGIGRL